MIKFIKGLSRPYTTRIVDQKENSMVIEIKVRYWHPYFWPIYARQCAAYIDYVLRMNGL